MQALEKTFITICYSFLVFVVFWLSNSAAFVLYAVLGTHWNRSPLGTATQPWDQAFKIALIPHFPLISTAVAVVILAALCFVLVRCKGWWQKLVGVMVVMICGMQPLLYFNRSCSYGDLLFPCTLPTSLVPYESNTIYGAAFKLEQLADLRKGMPWNELNSLLGPPLRQSENEDGSTYMVYAQGRKVDNGWAWYISVNVDRKSGVKDWHLSEIQYD